MDEPASLRRRLRKLQREYLVHLFGDLFDAREALHALGMPGGLRGGPAAVADVVERFHHGGPVVVAFEVLDSETGHEAALVHSFAAVFFDMELMDAFAE